MGPTILLFRRECLALFGHRNDLKELSYVCGYPIETSYAMFRYLPDASVCRKFAHRVYATLRWAHSAIGLRTYKNRRRETIVEFSGQHAIGFLPEVELKTVAIDNGAFNLRTVGDIDKRRYFFLFS